MFCYLFMTWEQIILLIYIYYIYICIYTCEVVNFKVQLMQLQFPRLGMWDESSRKTNPTVVF